MQARLNRSEFLAELAPMQGIVERRTTIPVLSHILLSAAGEKLQLAATDLDVSLTSWTAAEVKGKGAIAVQAKKFVEIIRAVAGDEVKLDLEDEKRLTIIAGKSRFRINGLSPDDFPTLPDVGEDGGVEIPFADLRAMIGKILFAVSSEESRFQLNGALLRLKDGALEIVATDGHRLALVENALQSDSNQDGVLVPRKALQELQRFEEAGTVVFRRSEHHLSFRLGRRELICRILEGTFPDYERVISKDNDKQAVFDRRLLAQAVQRIALLTGDRARAVRLGFATDLLTISAANPDLGEAVEEVPCEYSGDAFKLGINPDYMGQFLGALETDKVRFDLKDENTQCIGVPVDGTDRRYLCVIMPMRI
jgi:DNA polymerase III subunit beta